MINKAYNFACDNCGNALCYLAENLKDAKHEARLENWLMHGKRGCFCSQECFLEYRELTKKEENERFTRS